MDIGQMRYDLEDTRSDRQKTYGDGNFDELQDENRIPGVKVLLDQSEQSYLRRPDSWSRLLCWVTNNAVFSKDATMLRLNLLELGAIVTAWIEDIDRRTK